MKANQRPIGDFSRTKMKITTLPPEVRQHFDALLLSTPLPEFRDNLKLIWRMYLFIKQKLMKKANYNENTKKRAERLEQEFLELYERAKTKEEKLGEKAENEAKGLFYHINLPNRGFENIFWGLRKASYKIPRL